MMVINELLLEVRKSIRLHKLLISIANHMHGVECDWLHEQQAV